MRPQVADGANGSVSGGGAVYILIKTWDSRKVVILQLEVWAGATFFIVRREDVTKCYTRPRTGQILLDLYWDRSWALVNMAGNRRSGFKRCTENSLSGQATANF
jgi:hypothetical protein